MWIAEPANIRISNHEREIEAAPNGNTSEHGQSCGFCEIQDRLGAIESGGSKGDANH
jgi:hypothetical protein